MLRNLINKLLLILLVAVILIKCQGFNYVFADTDYYPMGCNIDEFEVSYIENDGKLTKVSCHKNLADAKKAMKKNNDYVVRYSKSYSPSKIVAMNSGLAYTYPGRRNSSFMYVIQNPVDRDSSLYKSTIVANHYEMTYIDTCDKDIYDISKNGKGYIQVVLNGFEGFTDIEYTDLVPTKYLKNGIPIWLGGKNVYEDEEPFLVKIHQNYYIIEDKGNYSDLIFYYHRAYGINGKDCLSYSISVDNAQNYLQAGMKKGVKYYSNDGINFYSDESLHNKVCSCYNYYQFLPLRSKTNISGKVLDEYINKMKGSSSVLSKQGNNFINSQNVYGCNGLLVYSMACLESAYGTSGYATNRNNLFGWSAYDDSPNDASYFSSVQSCVNEQMGRNLNWFMDYSNKRYFGTCVGNKGAGINVYYASDPYWGSKIASIAYEIDKYANNNNGKLSDYNKYTLGFVKNNYNDVIYDKNIVWNPNIYNSENGKTVLYTGKYGSHYQKDLTVIVLKDCGNRYQIQSTNAVNNGVINTDDGLIAYDFAKSVGYIDKENVVILNNNNIEVELDHEAKTSVSAISFKDNILSIKGIGLISNMNFDDASKISHIVELHSYQDDKKVYTYEAKTVSSDINLNDGFSYKYSGFEVDIDLSQIDLDSYYTVLRIINSDKEYEAIITSTAASYRDIVHQNQGTIYKLSTNLLYSYRVELDSFLCQEDYNISKPSEKSSLAAYRSLEIDDNGILSIEGYGLIYYLDYENSDENRYEIYIMNKDGISEKVALNNFETYSSLKDSLTLNNNVDYICFKGNIDLKEIDSGEYHLILKINNGKYVDYVEFNAADRKALQKNIAGVTYSLFDGKVRHRLSLKIED